MIFWKTQTESAPSAPEETDLKARVAKALLPSAAATAVRQELARLDKTDPSAAEYSIGLNYIDFILTLPWRESTRDNLDLERARSILAARHHGLEQVKERILEFLAAKTLRGLRHGRVLVVDDEEIARDNLSLLLGREGFATGTAANGAEALERMAEADYDVVVTDLKMDRMDGLELLKIVRKRWPTSQVVVITGYATVDSAVEAMRTGAEHYLSKPVDMEDLLGAVRAAVSRRAQLRMSQGPILCFAGPPGTGKTSIGRAIAEALERRFVRFSVGGLRDEAEIRGHRRTYVGAMPGRILGEIKRAGVNNPVIMLDEIDKIGKAGDFRGDPASVLLEVLDPEQNATFLDHYLDVPFNLSRAMFIATANIVEDLPGPLLDRMEVINFPGYSPAEKLAIARHHLLPRQLDQHGLDEESVRITDAALTRIISEYTREAGLRNLNRELAGVCRKLARASLERGAGDKSAWDVDAADVSKLLGPSRFVHDAAARTARVGVTTGLVWSEFGGEIIFVETTRMRGRRELILTGSLGEVLQESARIALSFIRGHARELGVDEDFFEDSDIHIHIPAGAVSKDGPSAGVTIAVALLSLLTGRPARPDTAMSGELALGGDVLPVTGIREKLLAARRGGVRTVILPRRSQPEIEALDPDAREGLDIVLADTVDDVVKVALLPAGGE